jgi:hypothetical protein
MPRTSSITERDHQLEDEPFDLDVVPYEPQPP